MTSKCNSPTPAIIVSPVSGFVVTLKVGSSSANLDNPTPNLSWSAFVFGSIAYSITGSGNSIFSRMMKFFSSQILSPVVVFLKPTAAAISPA